MKYFFLILGLTVFSTSAGATERDAETILREMAEDYAFDPTAKDFEIGFDISGEQFFITVIKNAEGPHEITFQKGFPDTAFIYWQMEMATLTRIDAGMTGETATQRSRAEDPRLMNLKASDEFPRYLLRRNSEFSNFLMSFKVHFFIKGTPEIIPIGPEQAVMSHGTGIIGLAYAPRMTAIIDIIEPGQKVNFEEDLDTNPFDTLFIAIEGKVNARIGGNDVVFEKGQAMYIPADVEHLFWNDFDEPFTGVMILYGVWLNESEPERPYPWW